MLRGSLFDHACEQASLFTRVSGVPCVVLDPSGAVVYPASPDEYPCNLCRTVSGEHGSQPNGERHMRWVDESLRFGGRCVFMCPNAFTHWTSPLVRDDRIAGALVAGPVLTIDEDDFFENELLTRFAGAALPPVVDDLRTLYARVPRLPPARVTVLSELLLQLSIAVSNESKALRESAESLDQQSRINEYIQELKARREEHGVDPDRPTYPLETESLLLSQIRSGDVKGSQRTLNELLGHVFFAAGSHMDQVKVRSRELVVLLSRAVLAEGSNPEEVFGLNYQFVDAIDHQNDVSGVAYWMARIVRRFAEIVLFLPHLGHARALRRAIAYIRKNVDKPLRLPEVAEVSGLSRSHFSRVFREEMGEPFAGYVNRVRCEKAAELLRSTALPILDVAHACGYADHSYFTKVFRSVVGTAPSAFRSS